MQLAFAEETKFTVEAGYIEKFSGGGGESFP
jgi:transcriptional regulator CtsR